MHFAGNKPDFGVRMSGGVVEKLVDAEGEIFLLCSCHVGGYGADGHEHGGVEGATVISEEADETLDDFSIFWSEWVNGGVVGHLLEFPIFRCCVQMGGMLGFGEHLVVEDLAFLCDVIRHAELYGAFLVVPVEMDAEEYFSIPIDGASKFFGKVVDEVLGIGAMDVFYAKIIHDETKIQIAGDVFE